MILFPLTCVMNVIGFGYVRRIPALVRTLPTMQAYRAMSKVGKRHTWNTATDIGLCSGMGLVSISFTCWAYSEVELAFAYDKFHEVLDRRR